MRGALSILVVCLTSLCLSGCLLPKKDPQLVAKIDAAFLQEQSETFEPGAWIPWKVGQWALIATEDSKGNRSLVEYSIVAQEGDGFWLQTVTTNEDRESEVQLFVEGYDPKNLQQTRIRKMRMKDENGKILEFDRDAEGPGGNILALTMGVAMNMANGVLASLQQTEAPGTPEDITVPAGTFKGAKKTPVSYNLVMGSGTGHIWYASVPVINNAQQVVTVRTMGFSVDTRSVLVKSSESGATNRF